MADLYVASTGSNTAPYDTWAKAATAPLTATAAAVSGDTIYQHAETFTISADTTYTLVGGVRWICTNDKVNEPPQTLSTAGVIDGSGTSGVDIYIVSNGTNNAFVYGLTFKVGTSTTSVLAISNGADDAICYESCAFVLSGTSIGSMLYLGNSSTTQRCEVILRNCSVKFGAAGQGITLGARVLIEGGVYPDPTGSVPTTLFESVPRSYGFRAIGADFSGMTSGTMFADGSAVPANITLSQCKLGAATLNSSISYASSSEYFLYDCSSTDTHYHIAHYSYLGSTTVSTAIYCNDGAEYNLAGAKCSWVVAGNANTSRGNPYISPWFPAYNEATSAVTPYIEILRDGSTTAFTDVQVASNWLLKTAGGSPLVTLYSDYGGHLSTGTAQDNGVGLSGWTGESGTAWSGRLYCPSVTPAEIGHVSVRVVVYDNITVYADPLIRGL